MKLDILMPLVTISGIAIALAVFLSVLGKHNNSKFDERQLIARGRAADLAMTTAMAYLVGLYAGYSLDLFRQEHMAVFAIYGLVIMAMVYSGYCIFHDAFLNREQVLFTTVLHDALIGVIWLAMALGRGVWDMEGAWINGALALFWLSQSVMLLLRALVLRIQERRAEREDTDG